MRRSFLAFVLAAGIIMVMGYPALAQEKVRFYDRKAKPPKEVTITGVIQEESTARIRIKPPRGDSRTLFERWMPCMIDDRVFSGLDCTIWHKFVTALSQIVETDSVGKELGQI